MEHPFIATLMRSGPVGQTILGSLLILSVYTWSIIITKLGSLRRAEKGSRAFLTAFQQSSVEWLQRARSAPGEGPLARIYEAGVREFYMQRELAGDHPPDQEANRRIEAALDAEINGEIEELERGHLVLAVAASACPFIGLFGTVWGIMNAFRGMSLEGSAGIAAVAPGVAEALVTTVAGLAVAIPSVIAYNVLNRRVQIITTILERFSTEFQRAIQFVSHRGAGVSPPPSGAELPPVFARRNV